VKRTMMAAVVGGVALGMAGASSVALAVPAYILPAPVAMKARHHPKIVARPDKVKVNKVTTLTGSGFKPHAKLVLNECAARAWIVPKQVCNHRNAVHVRTGPHGGFRVRMKVLVCPRGMQPQARISRILSPEAFVVHCFIGVPKIAGVDTVTLVGAVRISVTGP
jgi:hypothetical protein